MASRGTSFGKRERDRAKKERQQLKQERRVERAAATDEDGEEAAPVATRSTEDILAEVEALHIQMDEGLIDAEDFADKRAELMAQIQVD